MYIGTNRKSAEIFRSLSEFNYEQLKTGQSLTGPGEKRDPNSHCGSGSHLSVWMSHTDRFLLLFTKRGKGTDVRETGSPVISTSREYGLELRNPEVREMLGFTNSRTRAYRNAMSAREYLVEGPLDDFEIIAEPNEFKNLWKQACDSWCDEDESRFHIVYHGFTAIDKQGAISVVKDGLDRIEKLLRQGRFLEAMKGLYYVEETCRWWELPGWWKYVRY